MNVELRLFTALRVERQATCMYSLHEGATIEDLMKLAKIGKNLISVTLLNGIVEKSTVTLKNNDVVSLFPAIGGG